MKSKRQVKILELIRKNDIETQEELSDYLEKEGYSVCSFYTYDEALLHKGLHLHSA